MYSYSYNSKFQHETIFKIFFTNLDNFVINEKKTTKYINHINKNVVFVTLIKFSFLKKAKKIN